MEDDIEKLDIIKKIGEGGHADVYTCKFQDKEHVIKVFKPSKYGLKGLLETAIMSKKLHKNINHAVIIGKIPLIKITPNLNLLIFQDIASKDLKKWNETLHTKKEIKNVIFQITSGLNYFHSKNIIHGDIKPGNVLLFNRENLKLPRVKINDFSLVTFFDSSSRRSLLCTDGYCPLEVWLGREYGLEVDVFSLGCLIYELIKKKRLIPRQSKIEEFQTVKIQLHINALIEFSKSINPEYTKTLTSYQQKLTFNPIIYESVTLSGYSQELDNMLKKMLDPDPKQRPTIKTIFNSEHFNRVPRSESSDFNRVPRSSSELKLENASDCNSDDSISQLLINSDHKALLLMTESLEGNYLTTEFSESEQLKQKNLKIYMETYFNNKILKLNSDVTQLVIQFIKDMYFLILNKNKEITKEKSLYFSVFVIYKIMHLDPSKGISLIIENDDQIEDVINNLLKDEVKICESINYNILSINNELYKMKQHENFIYLNELKTVVPSKLIQTDTYINLNLSC